MIENQMFVYHVMLKTHVLVFHTVICIHNIYVTCNIYAYVTYILYTSHTHILVFVWFKMVAWKDGTGYRGLDAQMIGIGRNTTNL